MELKRRLEEFFGFKIEALVPDITVEEQADINGPELWNQNPDLCCTLRKVLPLRDKLSDLNCWITGLRRQQSLHSVFAFPCATGSASAREFRHRIVQVPPARQPYPVDMEAVVDAAARHGVALEINSQVDRLDLNDVHAKLARDRGVRLVVSSDAHSRIGLGALRWGVLVARRAWLEPPDVLNTCAFDEFRASLRRNRTKVRIS